MIKTYQCPNCAHELDFLPNSDKMDCKACGHQSDIAGIAGNKSQLVENSYENYLNNPESFIETVPVECNGCSGQFTLSDYTVSIDCPYCGNNTTVDESARQKTLKPTGIVPFQITAKKMQEIVWKRLGRNPFVPAMAKRFATEGRVIGIYVPSYSFDMEITIDYTGKRGKYVSTTNRNGETETKTIWHPVDGSFILGVDDLQFIHSRYSGLIEFKDSQNDLLKPYTPEYLSGFIAEGHSKPLTDSFKKGKHFLEEEIDEAIKEDIGGDDQRVTSHTDEYKNVFYRHFLFPLWVGDFNYKKNSYPLVVSGTDGSAQVKVPISEVRVALYFLFCTLLFVFLLPRFSNLTNYLINSENMAGTGKEGMIGMLLCITTYWYILGYALIKQYGVFDGITRTGKQSLSKVNNDALENATLVKDIVAKTTQRKPKT